MKLLSLSTCILLFVICSFSTIDLVYAQSSEEPAIVTTQILQTSTSWNNDKLHYPETESTEITSLHYEFPPGSETPWHRHPVPVLAYILSGDLEVKAKDTGETRIFRKGDAFAEVVNTWHSGKVLGNEPVKLIAFFLGESGIDLTELLSEFEED